MCTELIARCTTQRDQIVLLASVETLLVVAGAVATTPKYHVPLVRLLIV